MRAAHAVTPLMGADVLQLEAALSTLGRDATWVKGSEVRLLTPTLTPTLTLTLSTDPKHRP